jgi:hypothetical protein
MRRTAGPRERNALIKILLDLAPRERVVVVGAAVLLAIAGFYAALP